MKSLKFGAVLAAGAFALAGCSGEGSNEDVAPEAENVVDEVAKETAQESSADDEGEPCFTVGEVGSRLSLDWELVVASRGASDQPKYLEALMDWGDDLYEDIEENPRCLGALQLADFNYEVALLNADVLAGSDEDESYQKIADLGNDLIDRSEDEGYEWDYEFITDVSEVKP